MLTEQASMNKLRWIMTELRDPKTGCPWDIKQDFASIVPHTIEEAYEVADAVIDAVEQQDFSELEKELGDLLFQIVFYSQLGQEQKQFDFDSVVAAICEKLIRRHPHVFGDKNLTSDAEINANWENEKAQERQQKNLNEHISILADIPRNLPALSQAAKIQKRCAHAGFDWHNIEDVFAKVVEEVEEVHLEIEQNNPQALAEELGDLMFAVVNLCRHAKQDPEQLLRQANQKFTKRFHGVEKQVASSGVEFEQHSLEKLEEYWQQVKLDEKQR
ncbi:MULTISPECIES: nucleoside triphosphate pyrophosphohydrolase [unclassified Colwellia]|jgi:ATP diphosphatase|uniref:nucleoside triphosphate pyrophosphohydrolase n=1 Tax=unclassified Colwellia TaxID=196834 RepID=UPI0015F67BAA|nr:MULTISPECIES: nucleoside triphosphate pyrophosphohydrolase [unclassified Colwellia]MBA6362939.1 nucleoside triphosphate pyrophosphohydrolase [Colwellia sp. BRX8-8]MBA6335834.1 nucleoside triphosphate pyrophosphohydrolase [Colwellia sp. BRX8-7]MBA6347453.1 nucleoside triphosphate pyrophosphohydrolase [Colwellia sp. BRX8-9]MBA6350793.1 nucleoside triphosphate pyrophosphohydrolase [Colwellia sp. BRX9-1]MBA6354408.1 nucleoside triphosphate pyrophosphohydrolase [Colwellia sp. BRX8-3]|tara:strand:+ start:475 stop:1293 length:819 start_codon:yes stop_codon:yes gene_type:complete